MRISDRLRMAASLAALLLVLVGAPFLLPDGEGPDTAVLEVRPAPAMGVIPETEATLMMLPPLFIA